MARGGPDPQHALPLCPVDSWPPGSQPRTPGPRNGAVPVQPGGAVPKEAQPRRSMMVALAMPPPSHMVRRP